MKRYVSYLRVSTQVQGNSGLGLEAQRAAVVNFVKGGDSIIAEYVEIESGKNDNREELGAAIAHAKRNGAVLLIAKLDRLSRNVAFIFTLRDTKVEFVCADMPDANTLTVGIFAVMAQHEREVISKRTKDALAAKRRRGETLGNMANMTKEGQALGPVALKAKAATDKANLQARQLIELLVPQDLTLAAIAKKLNETGYRTRRGCLFTPTTVKRLSPS